MVVDSLFEGRVLGVDRVETVEKAIEIVVSE